MNILEKRELAKVIIQYNKGNLEPFNTITKKHCPSVFDLDCACSDGEITCKGNCILCWSFALREFAFNNFGVDLNEIKPMSRAIV